MCKCTAKRQKIYFKSFFIQESSLDPLQDIYKLTVVYFNQLLDACSTQKLLGVDSQNLKKISPFMSSWINFTSFDVKNEKWSENSKKYIDQLSGANTGLWKYISALILTR